MDIDKDIKENLDINLNENSNLYSNNDFLLDILMNNNNKVNLYSGSNLDIDKGQISGSDSNEDDIQLDILEIGTESNQGDINNTDNNIDNEDK